MNGEVLLYGKFEPTPPITTPTPSFIQPTKLDSNRVHKVPR